MNLVMRKMNESEIETEGVAPMPAAVPGEFVIYLGVDDVPEGLEAGMVELLLTWLEWVEVELQGFDDLVEELHRLRGAVMVAAVAEDFSPRTC